MNVTMKPTTRQRILDHLRKQQTTTVRELSHALEMTGANIRHHLAMLESNDLVTVVGQRREGRGRPVNIYRLSRRVLGDGLDKLASAMFDTWLRPGTDQEQETGLRSLAQRLAGEKTSGTASPVTQRLIATVVRLNEMHYQARWEAGAQGPRILLLHCPYQAIITDYPELCRMDAHLLSVQLDHPVEQVARLESDTRGVPFCAFIMSQK